MILIYFLLIVSLLGALFIAWEYMQGYASRKWPETNGKIVQSDIKIIPGNKKEKAPLIYYEYIVGNQTYYSRRLTMNLAAVVKNDDAEKLLSKYPLGKEVHVKYHPIFKGYSVLEVGPKQPFLHLFFFSFCILMFGLSVTTLLKPDFDLIKLFV